MYYLIGDYVRLGDTSKDPEHSTAVCIRDNAVVSMNRSNRKLIMHMWMRIHNENGHKPDELVPVLSCNFEELKRDYLRNER
jgi:hypothetical protein